MLSGRRIVRALEDETALLHEEAERYVRILDRDATLDDYRRYLATMAGYNAPLEAAFADHAELAAVGFDAPVRRKSHLLARDLLALGVPAWATCSRTPATVGLARTIGIAYVIESSTLGGRYILSRLPPEIDAVRSTATAFLAGYGEQTGALWRAFAAVVELGVVTPADERAAVEGALDSFQRLIDWLALHERRLEVPQRGLA